jgi:hypothetical protein
VFYMNLRTKSHFSSYNINLLVFITEADSVYCAVRTEYLNIVKGNIESLRGYSVAFKDNNILLTGREHINL